MTSLYCIHTKKLSCLKSGVEFDMNDILYEFKNLHHFEDSLTFGVKAVLVHTFRVSQLRKTEFFVLIVSNLISGLMSGTRVWHEISHFARFWNFSPFKEKSPDHFKDPPN